ncbi:hypothetical protein BJ875DRAFT_158403 [Amylocarpus encephaloides]|uniref:Rhodopsin domain-containing protein n=1 Tax=Amylocarpus encephaloides TaxID=45428 RepID=A0A9P8C2W4_9HELO|nr:hypothetical protein BJ875DRAFT_158403 [Amylocarpus encephaloides]
MAISLLFVSARLAIRIHTFGRLWFDDLFVVIGWLLILATAVIWNFAHRQMYLSSKVTSGELSPFNYPDIISDGEHYLRSSAAVLILFYSSLAAIKLSFLLFFKRLLIGVNNRLLVVQWWVVFAITIITWIASLADNPYECLTPSFVDIAIVCSKKSTNDHIRVIYIVNCVMDVVTDILILTIPTAILWNARITMRHRLALVGLFGLTVATMTIAIIRVAVVLAASTQIFDVSWLYTWSAIEPPVAVITSCLVSFRALFIKSDANSRPSGQYIRSGKYSVRGWRTLLKRNKNKDVALKDLSGGESSQGSRVLASGGFGTASSEQIFAYEQQKQAQRSSDNV